MTRHCDLLAGRTSEGFVVRVQGRGTATQSPALADFVKECWQQDPDQEVAVDLLACQYLDSTFLGCLLKLQRTGTPKRFQVVANAAGCRRLLASTQLDNYLSVRETAPRSTGNFVKIEVKPRSERELGRHIMEAHQALSEVPSDVADSFRRIAAQLKSELEAPSKSDPQLNETVVLPVQGKK